MKRLLFVLVALVLSAAAASADVTVTMSISGAAAQTSINGTTTTWAKGTKMRVDTEMSGQSLTILSDSATKQQWKIDHGAKQIEPFDPNTAMAALPVSLGEREGGGDAQRPDQGDPGDGSARATRWRSRCP